METDRWRDNTVARQEPGCVARVLGGNHVNLAEHPQSPEGDVLEIAYRRCDDEQRTGHRLACLGAFRGDFAGEPPVRPRSDQPAPAAAGRKNDGGTDAGYCLERTGGRERLADQPGVPPGQASSVPRLVIVPLAGCALPE